MRTELTVATALAGTLLATCLISGSAQATSLPVLKSDATGIVTLVGNKGGGGHGGGHGHGGGGGKHHGGGGGGKHHGDGGGRHYGYKGGGRHYAYKGRDHDDHDGQRHDHDGHKRYGHYGKYRHYGWYGLPYISYGYGGGCGWLYRNAINTGSSYWWNRYYECIGYY